MGGLIHCIATTLAILCLLIVLCTFVTIDNNDVPEQDISKRTGYPVWHPPIGGMNGRGNDEKFVAVILFSSVMMISSGYFIMKWACNNSYNKRKITFFVSDDDKTVSTHGFNVILGLNCLVTALTSIMFLWLDVGKAFSSFGIAHNAIELIILVNMHYGGRITSSTFVGTLSLYVLLSTGLCIFLTWPYDALWFKMQGLCIDWALLIQFTRTYFNTRKHIKNDSGVDPLIRDEDEDDERGERSDVVYNSNNDVIVHQPYQILLLIVALVFHLIGNVVSTIWIYELRSYEIFSFTYAISYPFYAYYVYLDTQAISVLPRKVIHLPDTTHWKIVLVTIFSMTLSFLTIRLGLPSIDNSEEGYFNSSVEVTAEETLGKVKINWKENFVNIVIGKAWTWW
ncbi:hypothetical protein Glove_543g89 [Diversispora epigaea]|uniref:Uncharacterized protein n=1 Tax=Diversispora epigaea TaxID=1348612 RepID=A0A397GI35_9GLOM|nr:hypothetical protein Glove_543g89 [Diversispora epigaea]